MKITQHGDNLWQLTQFLAFNSYLVREADGLTLIDTNMNGSGKAIFQAAKTIGLPIIRIALTHAHGDHAGSLDVLSQQVPDAVIAITQRTAAFLQGNLELLSDEPQTKLRGNFIRCTTRATQFLQTGDYVGSLQVIAAAGHTPDHIAFFDERDGTLIAGDAFQTQAGIAVSGITRWFFPFPAMATWHLPTALATARELCALKPSRLAVGHGRVLENPLAQMNEAIRVAEAKTHG